MRKIEKLYHRLHTQTAFEKRYPGFKEEDDKVHLLFISAFLSKSGYYRVIAPALELGRTGSHAAIISDIHKWDFTRQFGDYDSPVDEQLIRWAHYIVLPAMLTDATYTLKALKAKNKDVQFVMDIADNLHAIPKQHPQYLKITEQQKEQLLANIARMNIVTASSEGILQYYDDLLNRHYPDAGVYMEYLPDLVSLLAYRQLPTPGEHETTKLRIGIITSGATAYDLLSIRDVLKAITGKHGDKVELILFGWDGKLRGGDLPLQDIPFTYEKPVGVLDYFDTLSRLKFDIGLIPLKEIPFNTHGRPFTEYLEFAANATAVVASKLPPFDQVIRHGKTGFLVSSLQGWLKTIDTLIEDKELRRRIGKSALQYVWRNYSFTNRNIQALREVFI